MAVADPPETLSARLRAETRADHDAAQGSGFLDRLAAGQLPIEAYADLAAQHYFIYETLERAGRAMRNNPVAGQFVAAELVRLPSLRADLETLIGADWVDRIRAYPETVAYCDRLRDVAFDRAPAFVAHHYTRYLGDLSGGQFLGPAIARAYGLNGAGHRFFVFEGVEPPVYRAEYRNRLDGIDWSRAEEDTFMAEVSEAYRLNIEVLAVLKDRWAGEQR